MFSVLILVQGKGCNMKRLNVAELDDKLRTAVCDARVQAVTKLLEAGADVNVSEPTPLICLAAMLASADKKPDRWEILKALVEAGADVNVEDKAGKKALDWVPPDYIKEVKKIIRTRGKSRRA